MPPFISVSSNVPTWSKRFATVPNEMSGVLVDGGHDAGKEAVRLFERTTKDWRNKPHFTYTIRVSGGKVMLSAGTDDKIYGYVSEGTKPHFIPVGKKGFLAFQSTYHAKTTPGEFASHSGGASGPWVYTRKGVHHPGTKPRRFVEGIEKQMSVIAPQIIGKHVRTWANRKILEG